MASELLTNWLASHREHVFTNGRGTTIIINFPIEFEHDLFEVSANLADVDHMNNGVMLATTYLPISFAPGRAAKLTQNDKTQIRMRRNAGESTVSLSERFNVSRATISRVVNGHVK